MSDDSEIVNGWEIFFDRSYFDLWCCRHIGDRKFLSPSSNHFTTRQEAVAFALGHTASSHG